MKAKVEQFAKGIFEYETPQLLVSHEEINLTLDTEKTYVGEITVKNSKETFVTGNVYSSYEVLRLLQNQFSGTNNIIQYEVKGSNLKVGDSIKGEICIISDCGEERIPYVISTEAPSLDSSIGKIKDLFNFTNLAKTDWSEAMRLFKSEEFSTLLKYIDEKHLLLYHNLIKSKSTSQAMEEFLVAVKKKLPINFVVDKNTLHYEVGSESFKDKVTLMKDNWGYEEIKVTTDAPFITLEHKIIWSDYFIGNVYPLEFVIHPNSMRRGNNFGHIFLTSVHETMVVDVTCHYSNETITNRKKEIKEKIAKLTSNYISFRKDVLSLQTYVDENKPLLESLRSLDKENRVLYDLLFIHLSLISGEESNIEDSIKNLRVEIGTLEKGKDVYDSACLYLLALASKEEEAIKNALLIIKSYYSQNSNWKLLWFLLYLDNKYDMSKAQKLADLKEVWSKGCISPILYYEAMSAYNEEPILLQELGPFELQVLHWGIKNDFCKEEAANQFTYLVGKKKHFHRLYLESLAEVYNKYHTKDMLAGICSLLIKGYKRNTKYFKWFSLGVKEQLRITELYEYYMYTLSEEGNYEISSQVLLYFIYNSNLSDKKKAYLYSYIIRNKDKKSSLYETYYKKIENFASRFLKEHVINRDFALIYTEILKQSGISNEFAKELPEVMFKHEIECSNKNMKGVYVVTKGLDEEKYYPFTNQVAYVDIFTENYELIFVDYLDNRYSKTIPYTINQLMEYDFLIKECIKLTKHPMLILHIADKAMSYQKVDDETVSLLKYLLTVNFLKEEYRNRIIFELVQYFYDNFQSDEMEEYLLQVNPQLLSRDERTKVMELYIARERYEKVIPFIEEFGYEAIQTNKLMKLANYLLSITSEESENVLLTSIASFIFSKGKYNPEILNYLVKYYQRRTGDMYNLWEACSALELNTLDLEERLLMQMLYTEDYIVNSIAVFHHYYEKGNNLQLIRAFLSFHAYKYLVKGRIINQSLFEIMKKELVYEENDLCMLALLKKLSTEEYYSEQEKQLIDSNIHNFIKRGIILPFFKKFADIIDLNYHLNDKFYIEYITNPANKVTIHYQLEDDEEENYHTEIMPNVYLGIHIKEFILFYNDNIKYYISEETPDGEVTITESVNVTLGQDIKLEEDTWYNQINCILATFEMKDDVTLLEEMEKYLTTRYLVDDLFS